METDFYWPKAIDEPEPRLQPDLRALLVPLPRATHSIWFVGRASTRVGWPVAWPPRKLKWSNLVFRMSIAFLIRFGAIPQDSGKEPDQYLVRKLDVYRIMEQHRVVSLRSNAQAPFVPGGGRRDPKRSSKSSSQRLERDI